jgi:hypothetical protein
MKKTSSNIWMECKNSAIFVALSLKNEGTHRKVGGMCKKFVVVSKSKSVV